MTAKHITNSLFGEEEITEQPQTGHIIRVAFESAADACFDYLASDELWPVKIGQRIEVPFGRKNKLSTAFCVGDNIARNESYAGGKSGRKLKAVKRLIDKEPLVDEQLMALAQWISDYYLCPLGQVLGAMVPAAVKKGIGTTTEKLVYLSVKQAQIDEVLAQLRGKKQKQIIESLKNAGAYDSKTAIEQKALLQVSDSTAVTLKKLAQKQLIKTSSRVAFRSLPAIPESLAAPFQEITLNKEQSQALKGISDELSKDRFGVTLLHGVTDSGKTEIYIRAIQKVLEKGKTAIVLLPEIALTAQTVERFSMRFDNIAVMHSGLTGAQRNVQWQKIKAGDADVVIGARSAVFAPLAKLGLIVIDEEHEPSYKQDTAPRYNGRDVAIKRAQLAGAHSICGSATPSLESLHNCRTKKHFNLLSLSKRVMNLPAPAMHLIDMAQTPSDYSGINLISPQLEKQIHETLAKGQQAILLLNRRGYSNFVFCPSCKHSLQCRNCDVTMTFHKSKSQRSNMPQLAEVAKRRFSSGYAICHYCLAQTLVPKNCPLCSKAMTMIGLGSQRLEEELAVKFAAAKIERIDSDSMQTKNYYDILRRFSQGQIDILAGTQILAKGLHFPNVTLVGIISADTSLMLPDFRANERTFSLICQVAGRAGRSAKGGSVLIQTFMPNQPAIQFAMKNDYVGFVKEELTHRSACNLPPFGRIALVRMRDSNFEKLTASAKATAERINKIVAEKNLNVTIKGPMPAAIARIQRFYRMQIIVQSAQPAPIQQLFAAFRSAKPSRPVVKTAIDIDPVNLL